MTSKRGPNSSETMARVEQRVSVWFVRAENKFNLSEVSSVLSLCFYRWQRS